MLCAYTMRKFCTDSRGSFRRFIRDILKRHLEMKAPDWLAGLLDAGGNDNAAERTSARPPSSG